MNTQWLRSLSPDKFSHWLAIEKMRRTQENIVSLEMLEDECCEWNLGLTIHPLYDLEIEETGAQSNREWTS